MRFSTLSLGLLAVLLCASPARAESPLVKAFFEQREVVGTIFFRHGSSSLDRAAAGELAAVLQHLRSSVCASRLIRIEGFSGREGSAESAFRLSLNRAYAVAGFLEAKGVPCLTGINGYGAMQASAGDDGRDLRVEIAAYPRMFLFDFANARQVDAREVIRP